MCRGDKKPRTGVRSLTLDNFRALPIPDLVASSVATARSDAFRREVGPSAVADAGATGVFHEQTGAILERRLYDRRVAAVAAGMTETRKTVLIGTNCGGRRPGRRYVWHTCEATILEGLPRRLYGRAPTHTLIPIALSRGTLS